MFVLVLFDRAARYLVQIRSSGMSIGYVTLGYNDETQAVAFYVTV